MTDTQILAIAATIWIAPHLPKTISLISGLIMLLCAIASGISKSMGQA
jgi:hypothetical protein